MSDKYNKLLSDLEILASIQEGQTLSTSNMTVVDHNSYSTAFWRSLTGENRQLVISTVRNILTQALSYQERHYSNDLYQSVISAIAGVHNLSGTYGKRNDQVTASKFCLIANSTTKQLNLLREKYAPVEIITAEEIFKENDKDSDPETDYDDDINLIPNDSNESNESSSSSEEQNASDELKSSGEEQNESNELNLSGEDHCKWSVPNDNVNTEIRNSLQEFIPCEKSAYQKNTKKLHEQENTSQGEKIQEEIQWENSEENTSNQSMPILIQNTKTIETFKDEESVDSYESDDENIPFNYTMLSNSSPQKNTKYAPNASYHEPSLTYRGHKCRNVDHRNYDTFSEEIIDNSHNEIPLDVQDLYTICKLIILDESQNITNEPEHFNWFKRMVNRINRCDHVNV